MTVVPARARRELDPADIQDALILAGLAATCVPVAPGVRAFVEDTPDGPLIVRGVLSEQTGAGAVGRWLDSLPRDRTVLVPAVVSGRLAGMLERRGFRPHIWMDPGVGFDNGAYLRSAAA